MQVPADLAESREAEADPASGREAEANAGVIVINDKARLSRNSLQFQNNYSTPVQSIFGNSAYF